MKVLTRAAVLSDSSSEGRSALKLTHVGKPRLLPGYWPETFHCHVGLFLGQLITWQAREQEKVCRMKPGLFCILILEPVFLQLSLERQNSLLLSYSIHEKGVALSSLHSKGEDLHTSMDYQEEVTIKDYVKRPLIHPCIQQLFLEGLLLARPSPCGMCCFSHRNCHFTWIHACLVLPSCLEAGTMSHFSCFYMFSHLLQCLANSGLPRTIWTVPFLPWMT